MYFEEALFSKASALEVGTNVHTFVHEAIEDGYFELVTVGPRGAEQTMFVRPLLHQGFLNSEDGSQRVICVRDDGREIHIIFPPAELREVRQAGVLVGIEPLPVQSSGQ